MDDQTPPVETTPVQTANDKKISQLKDARESKKRKQSERDTDIKSMNSKLEQLIEYKKQKRQKKKPKIVHSESEDDTESDDTSKDETPKRVTKESKPQLTQPSSNQNWSATLLPLVSIAGMSLISVAAATMQKQLRSFLSDNGMGSSNARPSFDSRPTLEASTPSGRHTEPPKRTKAMLPHKTDNKILRGPADNLSINRRTGFV